MEATYELPRGTVRFLIRPSIGWQNLDKDAQPLLPLPQNTERHVCEGSATQGEGESASRTECDQLLDDKPKHFVDLKWMAGHLNSRSARRCSMRRRYLGETRSKRVVSLSDRDKARVNFATRSKSNS